MGWDSIGAAHGSIRHAMDASKTLLESPDELAPAKQREIVGAIVESLVEAKSCLTTAREDRAATFERIRTLSKALERQDAISKHLDAYYLLNEHKVAAGDPHCLRCWEVDHFLIHLVWQEVGKSECPCCDKTYMVERTPFGLNGSI